MMDILAIERRDERAVEPINDLVRHLIGLVFQLLDGLDVRGTALGRGGKQVTQPAGCFLVAVGDLDEEVEKLLLPGQQAHEPSYGWEKRYGRPSRSSRSSASLNGNPMTPKKSPSTRSTSGAPNPWIAYEPALSSGSPVATYAWARSRVIDRNVTRETSKS